jgi:peroxiredoxin
VALGLLVVAIASPRIAGAKDHLFKALSITQPELAVEAPDFRLADPEGRRVSLRDQRGKIVFLNFWATWCVPCRVEMPEMEKLYQDFRPRGFVVLAVDFRESPAQVRRFAQELKLTYPVLIDEDGSVFQAYLVRGLPATYLIDRKGLMVGRAIGLRDWYSDEARAFIRSLVEAR